VHDPFGVHVGERVAYLCAEPQREARRDAMFPLEPVLEGLALEQLHHVERAAHRVDPEVRDLCDAGRAELGERAGLAVEALDQLVVPALEAQDLEGESPAELEVLHLDDLPHPALAQNAPHDVAIRYGPPGFEGLAGGLLRRGARHRRRG
jgi:hypothetical protein